MGRSQRGRGDRPLYVRIDCQIVVFHKPHRGGKYKIYLTNALIIRP